MSNRFEPNQEPVKVKSRRDSIARSQVLEGQKDDLEMKRQKLKNELNSLKKRLTRKKEERMSRSSSRLGINNRSMVMNASSILGDEEGKKMLDRSRAQNSKILIKEIER